MRKWEENKAGTPDMNLKNVFFISLYHERGCCCEDMLIPRQHSFMQPSIMLITTDVNP